MSKSQRIYYNNAKTTLSSSIGASDTTIPVSAVTLFTPAPTNTQFFLATLDSGSAIEVIEVHGISGSNFINCVRGREGTTASAFLAGTKVENRATAGTLATFARYQDVLAPLSSLDLLDSTTNSDANSYILGTKDDGGNPIVVIANGLTWKFLNYSALVATGTLSVAGTTTSVPLAGSTALPSTSNAILIQFTSGANIGKARIVTNVAGNTLTWATALGSAPAIGDTFEVYQSSSSAISALASSTNNALIYSILFGE